VTAHEAPAGGPGGHLAEPARPGPGVLVVHDWFGLLPHVRATCDDLAGQGFVAFAPDLYQGRTTTDEAEAERLRDTLDRATSRRRLADGGAFLRAHRLVAGPVGAIGFSMGGWLALLEATTGAFDAVVAYYAALEPAERALITSPVLVHLAEVDDWEPPDTPETFLTELRAAGTTAEALTWPGTEHGFANADVAAYQPKAAEGAWAETLGFLRRHLGGG
jgi:carboxymethylenebutenolidase